MSRVVTHDGSGGLHIRFPFDRRLVELVKSLSGRRWHPEEKHWRVPEDEIVAVVDLLRTEGFLFDEVVHRIYRDRGGVHPLDGEAAIARGPTLPGLFDAPEIASTEGGVAPDRGAAGDLTVSALNSKVKDVVESAFRAPIWLVGEISGFNKSAHRTTVGFHLVEKDAHGSAIAQVSATLFQRSRREIERKLERSGNPFRLEDEVTVRVRARVEIYVPWGSYRVLVDDLDVDYTLGEAARRRDEIVRRLTAEGILERNRSLQLPAVPLRVALITSLGSDAYNDVLRTLQESGFAFRVTAHGARVQGRLTEPSVLNALDWFRERADEFDVLLICRGGGSRTDLAWFDSESLARAVVSFPRPVVIGIGHEQDLSVLDFVGWRCKTPTAAAGFLVERVTSAHERTESSALALLEAAAARLLDEERRARERAQRLARAARGLFEQERLRLDHRRSRAVRASRSALHEASSAIARRIPALTRSARVLVERRSVLLDQWARQLLQAARRDVEAARRRVAEIVALVGPRSLRGLSREVERSDARARRLHLVDPRRVVERGYAILRAGSGRVLTDAGAAPAGTAVEAELRRGALRLVSEGPKET